MHLIQFVDDKGNRAVGVTRNGQTQTVTGVASVYELAQAALNAGSGLAAVVDAKGLGAVIDKAALLAEGRLLSPIDHPDATHLHVTGTGLTHLGSAATRDAMHKANGTKPADELTDSMKMFRMGLENGKPAAGETGVQPEWFYKGNGHIVAKPGEAIPSPSFALDAGEEPEIAGIYIIDQHGQPRRLGFALANEFSDHVTERINYLYLAHSKLRACSFGPELRVGDLPAHIEGTSRILRDGAVLWEKPFLSGEDNMSHTIANLEYHHFKYELFRQPGDVHVHMFGTATLSFADGISTQPNDTFEITESQFGLPLRNPVRIEAEEKVVVTGLY
ncbi:AraD1 family protein [Devosia sp. 63-57]|uniref:AraD1 family protein n=1 Tax=Devosia sp. 63-57 TaxID=1895751 RepID=UPI00086D2C99|nr:AraD1 family protein [Devosia sp. 63-57]ODT50044.1 MAG: GguC protein [Pelagibacterium sp. SCN 63-126]ODU85898.1 MAG: GguC protein [Pelagibacterium sp. SCN 63-17]OJX45273.1 MAG: GguC protein [Devosia sp. 63-57]